MNKEEALKKLDSLEKEAKELRKIIEKPESLYDKIKTFSDVCKELNEKELDINYFTFLPDYQRIKAFRHYQIQIIAKLFNDKWKPNWLNINEYKYYPWFDYKLGGWSLDTVDCRCSCSAVEVACFKNKKDAEFVATTFKDIYIDYLNN